MVTQAKVRLQKSGSAGQLLKIKDQYECLVKFIEKMESAKYTIKEAVHAIQELDFGEDTCNVNEYIKKKKCKTMKFLKEQIRKGKIFHRLCMTCFKIFSPHLLL